MSSDQPHIPVLYETILDASAPRPDGKYIDATVGGGGHARGILERSSPTGKLLGIDADTNALAIAGKYLAEFGDRVVLVQSNFANLESIAQEYNLSPIDGLVLDLGISSMELADDQRGFSFRSEGALDMRYDQRQETTAGDLVNDLAEHELADLVYEYGEEHASRRIARAVVSARPIATAAQLADVIERAVGRRGRIHPATRTFQALRIAVNQEMERLDDVLSQIANILAPQGRVAILAYHSLEDRKVKTFFRQSKDLRVLTKHPLRPLRDEIVRNPRSRSAKLRVAERIVL